MFIIYVFVIVCEGFILLTANMIFNLQEVSGVFFLSIMVYMFRFTDNCIGLDAWSNYKDLSYL